MNKYIMLLPAVLGCGQEEVYCTEMGCASGLFVNIIDTNGDLSTTDTHGSITIDSTVYTFDCREGAESEVFCGDQNLLIQVEQGSFYSFSVYQGEIFTFEEGELNFSEFAPNGEDCPPVCYTASIEVDLGNPSVLDTGG